MRNKDKGQGMMEFALTFSIFLMLVMGILEFAWLFFFYNSIASGAREAARYGAGWEKTTNTPNYTDCVGIQNAAKRVAWVAGLRNSDIEIDVFSGPENEASPGVSSPRCDSAHYPLDTRSVGQYDRMYVKIIGHYHALVGLIPIPPMDMKGDSSYTIMQDIAVSDK
jgi:hypothetical protein